MVIVAENLVFQEKVDVIVVSRFFFVVHAEGSVNMPQVMVVIELLEEGTGDLSWTSEAVPQVIPLEEEGVSFLVGGDGVKLDAVTPVWVGFVVRLILVVVVVVV